MARGVAPTSTPGGRPPLTPARTPIIVYLPVDRGEPLRRLTKRNRREDANALLVSEESLDDFFARFDPRTPEAASRWTWLILADYTQLRLARPLAADRHQPWEKPARRTDSPPPESAAASGTSARNRPVQPKHRNPRALAPDGRRAKNHPPHTPPRRAFTQQNCGSEKENDEVNHPTTTPHRLNIKLGARSATPCRGSAPVPEPPSNSPMTASRLPRG